VSAGLDRESPLDRLANELQAASDPAVRMGLIRELGDLEDPRAIEVVARYLDAEDFSIRAEACAALGRLDGADGARYLRRALHDEDRWVRSFAAGWLGTQRSLEAVPDIAEMLRARSWLERVQAASALGEIGDVAAEEELRAARKRTWRPWRKLILQRRLRRSRAVRAELGPAVAKPPPDPEYVELLVRRAAERSTYLGERPARNQAAADAVTEEAEEAVRAGWATVEVRDIPAPLEAATEITVRPRDPDCCAISVRVEAWMLAVHLGKNGASMETADFGARAWRRRLAMIRKWVRVVIEGGYAEYVHRDSTSGKVKVAGQLSRRGWPEDVAYRNTLRIPGKGLERRGWELVRYSPYDPGFSDRPDSHEAVVASVTDAVRDVVDRGLATIDVRDTAPPGDEPITEIALRPIDAGACPIKVQVEGRSALTLLLGRHDASSAVLGLSTQRRLRKLHKHIDAAIAGEYKEYVWRDPGSGAVKVRGELRAGDSPGERFGDANTLRWESLADRGWEYQEYAAYDSRDEGIASDR
jgi:HEAT repeat protein/PBS lyase HEAT-like repeat-containing protein